eukprot:603568_1
METCTPKELSLNISSLPNQNEDQTNQIQSKHDDDESTSHNNDMLYCTKRKMLFSSCAIALSIGICSVLLILNINDDDQESDLKLCAMFFVLCMIIAMSFNENNSKKRYIFIAILMVTICSIFKISQFNPKFMDNSFKIHVEGKINVYTFGHTFGGHCK